MDYSSLGLGISIGFVFGVIFMAVRYSKRLVDEIERRVARL